MLYVVKMLGVNVIIRIVVMEFFFFLQCVMLIQCYKCFLVDVIIFDGCELMLYCLNMGVMIGCVMSGDIVWYLILDNIKWKYLYIWELI